MYNLKVLNKTTHTHTHTHTHTNKQNKTKQKNLKLLFSKPIFANFFIAGSKSTPHAVDCVKCVNSYQTM